MIRERILTLNTENSHKVRFFTNQNHIVKFSKPGVLSHRGSVVSFGAGDVIFLPAKMTISVFLYCPQPTNTVQMTLYRVKGTHSHACQQRFFDIIKAREETLNSELTNKKTILEILNKELCILKKIKHKTIKDRVYRLIRTNPKRKWCNQDICNALYLSRSTLNKHLKSENTSFKEIVHQVRMEKASRCIAESDLNISEVARITGFTSLSYFCKKFRETFGYNPKKFREIFHHPNIHY